MWRGDKTRDPFLSDAHSCHICMASWVVHGQKICETKQKFGPHNFMLLPLKSSLAQVDIMHTLYTNNLEQISHSDADLPLLGSFWVCTAVKTVCELIWRAWGIQNKTTILWETRKQKPEADIDTCKPIIKQSINLTNSWYRLYRCVWVTHVIILCCNYTQ